MEAEEDLQTRAEIFRFPAQVASLERPLGLLVETTFGESRYEESAVAARLLPDLGHAGRHADRPAGRRAGLLVRSARRAGPRLRQRSQPRSFFLRRLLTDVVFGEAGLGTLDPKAEARRTWLWRGARGRRCRRPGARRAGAHRLLPVEPRRGRRPGQTSSTGCAATLAPVAARQAPLEPLDLELALDAATEVAERPRAAAGAFARLVGPSAAPQIEAAQETAYDHSLRTILEPRMVALLEATMWRQIRDPDFQLGALKTYRMMTGLSPMDAGFAGDWWTTRAARVRRRPPPFPTEAAQAHQLAAIERMPYDASFIAARRRAGRRRAAERLLDPARASAPTTRCSPTRRRPRCRTGSRRARRPERRQGLRPALGQDLRVGIEGIYTYAGFHDVVLDAAAGRRRPGRERPRDLRRRLPGERRGLGRAPSPRTC